jgi:hypothetical protein
MASTRPPFSLSSVEPTQLGLARQASRSRWRLHGEHEQRPPNVSSVTGKPALPSRPIHHPPSASVEAYQLYWPPSRRRRRRGSRMKGRLDLSAPILQPGRCASHSQAGFLGLRSPLSLQAWHWPRAFSNFGTAISFSAHVCSYACWPLYNDLTTLQSSSSPFFPTWPAAYCCSSSAPEQHHTLPSPAWRHHHLDRGSASHAPRYETYKSVGNC